PPEHVSAPMVFVGYGLVVPEMKYDDLAGLDLRGKIAVYLTGGPSSISGSLRSHYQSSAERNKVWQQAGVVGTVAFTNPPPSDLLWTRARGARPRPAMSLVDRAAPNRLWVLVNPAQVGKLLVGTGHTAEELFPDPPAGKRLPTFAIPATL